MLLSLSLSPLNVFAVITPRGAQGSVSRAAAEAQKSGVRYLQKGRYAEAIEAFKKAVALEPGLVEAHFGLGYAYKALGRYEEAVAPLNSAIGLKPDLAPAYYLLGETYFRLFKYEPAIEALKRAIALKVDKPRAYSLLGYAAYKSGRWDEAVAAYKEFIRRTKEDTKWERRLLVWFNLYNSNGEEAASLALSNLKKDGWQSKTAPIDVLMAYFGYMQAKRETDARKILDEGAAKVSDAQWPYPVIRYLRHEITADTLLDIASGKTPSPAPVVNGSVTAAHAFIGTELALSGRKEDALLHLKWVKDNGQKDAAEYEYLLAVSELARLTK